MKLAIWVLCAITSQVFTQQEHSFKEFYDIMENSKFTYTISELKETVQDTATPPLPISADTKAIEKKNGIEIVFYKRSSESKKLLEAVEANYKNKNNEKVRALCIEMLAIDSMDSKILTYLGETYQKENKYNEAIGWYNKALKANYNNWLTHMSLGKCYSDMANADNSYGKKCIEEYATAMLLNRSFKFLELNYQKICKKYNKEYNIWRFVPQCNIRKNKKTVYIETDETWLGYAVAKAVREYEPGYSTKNKADKKTVKIDTSEEKEYLLNFITANAEIDSSDSQQRYFKPKANVTDPAAITLIEAVNKGMLNEYIIYEMWLPKNPIIIYGLPRESLEGLVKYVLEVRTSED
ncbi:MAG: hypothetical protein A2509_09250 [Candidatus Edwardsbacteria bacterium RIFOXYD12_FULL_50_11]|uniref:Uncharacterized protein n=1 Tax=Candidatus Edwardsbacteria bacterium GWF2_54_11 TaxID=1817851 RepID=A0A1F5R4F8_9BACT|nr:MAG: hypothetical protein A2502_08620 [Candidatus Edwardsbacteria bacterium RifOxyC12_full_54_24]OGF07348.1 MAG: hypothetical protein A2273_02435 [Candidatus Edwardsbacteria bacterium RifOxyA12_full_54_48]OGF09340.1 MAG: hypothetical protein A2024_08635 [Candidatus Edwardsbacteria bacterium GWF2_54_11]OGF09600.1 MAG: hypothetical protein A3K15_08845 [Candidatus Edwardsbacteria bacterium GWE2_54_12]OGF18043.1 MAG: hypothetical protein A2509_09250 [Candidatus Edwardsbacteria bacterium RIFOXYD1